MIKQKQKSSSAGNTVRVNLDLTNVERVEAVGERVLAETEIFAVPQETKKFLFKKWERKKWTMYGKEYSNKDFKEFLKFIGGKVTDIDETTNKVTILLNPRIRVWKKKPQTTYMDYVVDTIEVAEQIKGYIEYSMSEGYSTFQYSLG